MSLILTSQPALEPISLAEAKAHLRLDTSTEDLLITALISTARLQIEAALSIALIHQTWTYVLDRWPPTPNINLPLSPVAELLAVRTFDQDHLPTPQPLTAFQLDGSATPPRLRRNASTTAPTLRAMNAIEISFIAGFGATPASVPAPIRQALLLLVAHWFEHRDPADAEQPATTIPDAISSLIAPWRPVRLA
jgi:uncharacterized phiE125 gp8 family phage protein